MFQNFVGKLILFCIPDIFSPSSEVSTKSHLISLFFFSLSSANFANLSSLCFRGISQLIRRKWPSCVLGKTRPNYTTSWLAPFLTSSFPPHCQYLFYSTALWQNWFCCCYKLLYTYIAAATASTTAAATIMATLLLLLLLELHHSDCADLQCAKEEEGTRKEGKGFE